MMLIIPVGIMYPYSADAEQLSSPSFQIDVNGIGVTGAGKNNGTTMAIHGSAGPVYTIADKENPTAPADLTVVSIGTSAITFNWSEGTDDTSVLSYDIYRDNILIDNVTETSYTDSELTDNTSYSYSLVTIDVVGKRSSASPSLSVTTYKHNSAGSTRAIRNMSEESDVSNTNKEDQYLEKPQYDDYGGGYEDSAVSDETEQKENIVPKSLFDINLVLDDLVINKGDDITANLFLTSFGTSPTSVTATFQIFNEQGDLVKDSSEQTIVETEQVIRKPFTTSDLPLGIYTLKVNTLYNQNVSDEFTQEFEIVDISNKYFTLGNLLTFSIVLLLFLLFLFILKRNRKSDE